MNMKVVARCSPMFLLLVAGAARAGLEPFSFDASETVKHDSNILRSEGSDHKADWMSTTELSAAVDQTIGREKLVGSASVNADRYDSLHQRNSTGYAGSAVLDWSTIGDLSGALGGDVRRHQYINGFDGDLGSSIRNLQTDNHAFASVQLGGLSRWSIFSGFDASERKYSDPKFDVNESQQWAVSGGTNYSTSPDLSFGINGRYIRGRYPKVVLNGSAQTFNIKTLGVHTNWAASGNSAFDANVGYTQQRTDGQPDQHYISGGLNWRWTPPSHFSVNLGLSRDASTSVGTGATIVNTNNSVNDRSLNTTAHLGIGYALTAKISLNALTEYIHRHYSDVQVPTGFTFLDGSPVFTSASGKNDTARFTLSAQYTPTRTTKLSCGYSREVHTADQAIRQVSTPFTDNTVMCSAAIHFD